MNRLVILGCFVAAACGGSEPDSGSATGPEPSSGGERTAPATAAPDGGASAESQGPELPDPSSATLDEPPPPAITVPANLMGREGVPAEGILREEPRSEGGVRLVAALPVSTDGNALFEIQTTPGRSGGLAVFAIRAVHPAARWASCSTLALEGRGRPDELEDVRVLAGASPDGVLEVVRAAADLRSARRLVQSRTWRVSACGETFEPTPAARPLLERFLTRFDELSRAPATSPTR